MKEDKIDKIIQEKFNNRSIQPSESAWERLAVKLDEQEVEKKNTRKRYWYYVASVVVLLGVGLSYFNKEKMVMPVEAQSRGLQKVDYAFEATEIIIKNEEIITQEKNDKKHLTNNRIIDTEKVIATIENQEILHLELENTERKEINTIKKYENKKEKVVSRVKVNGADLLYAITHTPDEVKQYYAQHKIERKSVIDSIQKELQKANLKINPETILAEVEQDILDNQFKGNFMQKLKSKISDIAIAVADRNN
ncbi:hypothetical protein ACQY1Q_10860 [Tenacibaculum sp. TC6]|uniref:hypothetical protein n=1 Tax=Tenacibaculum sp. TC6 TaxID=3423223 RepID=UPI003D35EA94